MRATIKANGTMVITPGNALEAYALKQWKKDQKTNAIHIDDYWVDAPAARHCVLSVTVV